MLLRRKAIEATGGFDPGYFLYFEDFDWSVRLNRVTRSVYVPTVRVVHHGGGAAAQRLAPHRVLRAQRRALFQQERLALVVSTTDAASPYTGRLLVTGAGGFIGRALCARLAAAQVPYVGAVRALAAGRD